MPDYLLDTNVISHWYNTKCDEHANVVAQIKAVKKPDSTNGYISRFFVSVVTLGEIEYGSRASHFPDAEKPEIFAAMDAAKFKFVLEQCPVHLDITKHAAEQYGELKAWLFNTCAPKMKKSKKKRAEELIYPITGQELGIDENDLWIAAQAKVHDLVLVTHDSRGNFGKLLKDFATTLKVEDWAS